MSDTSPWTIKAVPVETRQKAVRAAYAQGVVMAEWITDAVNRLADQQAGNLVIPPGKPEMPQQREAMPSIDLMGLAAAIEATVTAAEAAGRKPPAGLAREAAATVRQAMRAARGLPARQTKAPRGQTIELIESGDPTHP
jgi:hypothetical protein